MINETSTKTFVNNNLVIADRFIKLQTLYSNITHEIVKVHDKRLDREVVLKIIKNKKNKYLLENEFKVIVKLNSPYIIRGYELYSIDDYDFYSMELIESNFRLNYLNDYVHGIFKAFELLHKKGFIHDDIKLNNFLFENTRVVLIDFSKAKKVKTYTEIASENQKLVRFMVQWINYNLEIDLLGNPRSAENYINKKDLDKLTNIFYRKG